MATTTIKPSTPMPRVTGTLTNAEPLWMRLLKYLGLVALDAMALLLVYGFVYDGNIPLAITVALVTLLANVVVFMPSLAPIRWITPGMMLVGLLVLYPIVLTVSTAFTNYSNVGHPYVKEQAVAQIIKVGGSIPSAATIDYGWDRTLYQAEDGTYAVWITSPDGVETLFVPQNAAAQIVDPVPAEPPATFEGGYTLVERLPRGIQEVSFGTEEDAFVVKDTRTISRGQLSPKYTYDAANDTITDNEVGTVYVANDSVGYYFPAGYVSQGGRADDEASIRPGYRVFIGLGNFTRLINDPALSGPLVQIFIWTIVFALLSVLSTFALGLLMALIMNDPIIPARKVWRSLLLIPYAIPGVISIVVWRGMLNLNLGIINQTFGLDVNWLNDPFWSKFAIILVNLWLGYPYMMLICSGALQSIPSEVYEAASVDGANPWQKFWGITLPLLLVAMGPLLIGSFVFNFNNYLLITALTGGNPPINGSPIPGVGQTDILISYVYKSAFSNQADYGYASAITIIIFFIVATITLIQYSYTRTWEQVSENV
ncbi:MAG: ABC transporter permease subunit [Armatimonadetes bacterium]|nr:ABC transporter permease subunit [Anaerolineae bacterium]